MIVVVGHSNKDDINHKLWSFFQADEPGKRERKNGSQFKQMNKTLLEGKSKARGQKSYRIVKITFMVCARAKKSLMDRVLVAPWYDTQLLSSFAHSQSALTRSEVDTTSVI